MEKGKDYVRREYFDQMSDTLFELICYIQSSEEDMKYDNLYKKSEEAEKIMGDLDEKAGLKSVSDFFREADYLLSEKLTFSNSNHQRKMEFRKNNQSLVLTFKMIEKFAQITLNLKELKAIFAQCEELGWLQEDEEEN